MKRGIFRKIISQFRNKRCVVVGDVMVDEWIWGNVSRISPEAPVPIVDVTRRTFTAGGASNVAANLRAMGGRVSIFGVIGCDEAGRILSNELKRHRVATHGLLTVDDRPTTQKTRIIAHSQQVVRADFEQRAPLNGSVLQHFKREFKKDLAEADLIVVSDYGKGIVTEGLVRIVKEMALEQEIPVIVGPKPGTVHLCKGVTALTLNQNEGSQSVGYPIKDKRTLERAGEELLKISEAQAVLLTRGAAGMSLFRRGKTTKHLPAHATQVYDVSGAGDTVLAVFALTLVSGGNWLSAMELANLAAAIVVRKVGTATALPEEIEELL